MNIHEFKIGDFITRVEPCIDGDASYIGAHLEFKGIRNGCIYVYEEKSLTMNKMAELELYRYANGWQYWEDESTEQNASANKNHIAEILAQLFMNEKWEDIAMIKEIFEEIEKQQK